MKKASLKEIRDMKERGQLGEDFPDAELKGEELPKDFWKEAKLREGTRD